MSKSNELYMDELGKAHELIADLVDILLRAQHLFSAIDGKSTKDEKLFDDYQAAISKAQS